MKMKHNIYKGIINRSITCLFVLVMMGVFNISVAQNKQIQSNERQVVECTPIKTKRDIANERGPIQEPQRVETNERSNGKYVLHEGDNNQDVYVKLVEMKAVQQVEMKSAEEIKIKSAPTEEYIMKVVKKIEVINDK